MARMTIASFKRWRRWLIEQRELDRSMPPEIVVRATMRRLVLLESVPATRGDCPTERPCPHIRCRMHLWTAPMAGRPGLSSVKRDARGFTVSQPGNLAPHESKMRLEPRWLESKLAPSCALDVADTGQKCTQEVSEASGRHRTLIAREIRGAVRKACDAAEEMGVDRADFVGALMKMGEGR